ncbi:MAG: hypothetical protein WCE64_09680 [Bacteroidales bacterium]
MSEKKQFAIRIDGKIFRAVEKWAADELRSTNAQIEFIIDQALRQSGRLKSKTESPKQEEEAG